MKNEILQALDAAHPWAPHLNWFETIDSTNDWMKKAARQGAPEGTIAIADHQTGGHGRMGRTFQSPGGMGVYMSVLLRPQCPATELMHLTCAAAVAMCDAAENAAGLRPGIKWTNDLVWGKRKLGGILTELGFSAKGAVDYAIIGIGINCTQREEDFGEEIRSIAASLDMATGRHTERSALAAAMIKALHNMDLPDKSGILERYRKNCITLGQEICLVQNGQISYGKALDVDDNGALVVAFSDGSLQAVNSGEVSVRGMYGYI